MAFRNSTLALKERRIGRWTVPTIELTDADRPPLCLPIIGYIVNSITERKDKLRDWKLQIASEVKVARGGRVWTPNHRFAISVGFSFNPRNHGYQPLDVENFVKPVIDALAAGLFCDQETDPSNIQRWDYDDSNFNTLLVHRLFDASNPRDEGIAVCVSSSS